MARTSTEEMAMKSIMRFALAWFAATWLTPGFADLNVSATVPEWGALAQELGGEKVKVYVATNALQDPHRVEARPSLIARALAADLVVATGAELEVGWLPLVIQQAGNAKVQAGRPGYFAERRFVSRNGKPPPPDPPQGDIPPPAPPPLQPDTR